ncbi:MAG: hypothetical protein EOP90_08955 [Lysobacteraceae bacterium]|nr:MAG: hypothetical protein EOP90_08955 [Xanthomonadaceae bacterium]
MHDARFTASLPRAIAIVALACCSGHSAAQHSPALDRASLWIGGYRVDTGLRLEAEHDDIGGGSLDFAGDHETIGRARLDLLVGDGQGLTFDWYALDHADATRLARAFAYEGTEFEVDATLRSDAEFTAATAAWHWWLGEDRDVFGLGLGAAWYRLELALVGTAAVGDEHVAASAAFDESAIAPLVTLGYKHAFDDNLRVYAQASGIRKGGGALSGHIHDARVGFEWFPWRHVGVGAEYGLTRIRLERDGDDHSVGLDIDLQGPALFARMRF